MQQEHSPIEPAGGLSCSHPGRVLLQDYDNRESELIESDRGPWARRSPRGVAHPRYANPSRCNPGRDEHQLVRDAAGGLAHRASRRATLFAPGAGAPTKTITPGRGELKPVPPGRDEHQLVRGAAGGLAHRASRGTRLFAPGAGAPTRLRCPEGRLRCPEGASLSPPYTRKMM